MLNPLKSTIFAAVLAAAAATAAVAVAQGTSTGSSTLLQELPADFMGSANRERYVSYVEVVSHPAIARAMAAATRNYYDALVKAGFSKDEALRIVASSPSPVPLGHE
jgi:ABC-type tungstate transport system permease subunit